LIETYFLKEYISSSGVAKFSFLRDAVAVVSIVFVGTLGPREGAGEAKEEEEESVCHDDGVVEVDDGRDGDHAVAHSLKT